MQKENIESFATLAYAVADQPNHIDEKKLDALAQKLFAPDAPTSSDSHGPNAHLYVFAKYIQSVPYTGFSPQTRDSSRSQ